MIKKVLILLFAVSIILFCGCPTGQTDPPEPDGYRVYYEGNGAASGESPVDETVYFPDPDGVTDLVIVLGNTGNLVKDGYMFTGWSLSADGLSDYFNEDDTFNIGPADVVLYARWVELVQLLASVRTDNDQFGASSAISGNNLIIGTIKPPSGEAYIFNRTGLDDWVQEVRLTTSAENDYFGYSAAIDGDYAIVGAFSDDRGEGSIMNYGAAYVYHRLSTGEWEEQARLTASDGLPGDYFGISVAISDDYAVIGASEADNVEDLAAVPDSGSAYVFYRTGETWTQQKRLLPVEKVQNDSFGISVAISENYALMGSYNKNSNAGSVYLFLRTGEPDEWADGIEFAPGELEDDDAYATSLSASGEYFIVGAPGYDTDVNNSGAAFIFHRTDKTANIWDSGTSLIAIDGERNTGDAFGASVSISDGWIAIGASQADGGTSNSGCVFTRYRTSGGSWIYSEKLSAPDAAVNDGFGISVSIDGGCSVIGADHDDVDSVINCGSVWVIPYN